MNIQKIIKEETKRVLIESNIVGKYPAEEHEVIDFLTKAYPLDSRQARELRAAVRLIAIAASNLQQASTGTLNYAEAKEYLADYLTQEN